MKICLTFNYDRHGVLNDSDIDMTISTDRNGWIEKAMCYSEVLDAMIECTKEVQTSDKWTQQVVQDFCNRETAERFLAPTARMG